MERYIAFGEIMLRLKPPGFERFLQSPMFEATFEYFKKYGKTRVLHLLNHKYDDIELRREIE